MGYLFRGILIGLLFGVPAGAVGAMTAQRAYSFGLRAIEKCFGVVLLGFSLGIFVRAVTGVFQ